MKTEFVFQLSGGANPLDLKKDDLVEQVRDSEEQNSTSSSVENSSPSLPSTKTRTQIVASECLFPELNNHHAVTLPLNSRYVFKDWFEVMSAESPQLYAKIVKARYKVLIKQLEVERQQEVLIQYWEHLKKNFQKLLFHLQSSHV